MRKKSVFFSVATLSWCLCMCAPANDAYPKLKPRLLKGTWQLVQTYALGAQHQVKKDEYDGVMCFRTLHRYYEEVNYESNHWVIIGKWHVNRKKRTLELTQRNYVLGKLEEHPKDIILDIMDADGKRWSGSSNEKGQAVQVFYAKVDARGKHCCW